MSSAGYRAEQPETTDEASSWSVKGRRRPSDNSHATHDLRQAEVIAVVTPASLSAAAAAGLRTAVRCDAV